MVKPGVIVDFVD